MTTGIKVLMTVAASLIILSSCSPCRVEYAMVKATDATISNLRLAVDLYAKDCGKIPTEAEGLKALLTNPGVPAWEGPYIRGGKIPKDPWGNAFRYTVSSNDFLICSAGPDLKFDTADDRDGTEKESRTGGCTVRAAARP
jgi:general secretion pathway protein G